MIKKQITLVNDFSGGEDTKTPISVMGLNKSPNMRNWHCAGLGSRLIKRGGFAKVNVGAVASDELDTFYPPGYQTYDYALRDTVARTQISQGFKPKTSAAVQKVRLWLKKEGTPTGDINIEIQTDSLGKPAGTGTVANGTSADIDISTLTTSYAWYTFTFATQPTLTAGTQYHIAFQGDNAINGTAYAIWGADDYDVVFVDGTMGVYNGSTWAADSKYDAVFEVYITGGASGNDGFALWDFSSRGMMLGIWGTTLYKMDKNSAGTPDGTWDNLYNVDTELDYMEYATDAAAQAAYVSSDTDAPLTGDLVNEPCDDLDDWTSADTGDGATTVDPAGQYKLDSGSGAGNDAGQFWLTGSFPDLTTLEIRLKHDALGTTGNDDYFRFRIYQADERFWLKFGTDGLFIRDTGSGDTEVGTNLVKSNGSAEFQTWRFLITYGAVGDGTCDVYLKDTTYPNWEKVGTAIPCSIVDAGTAGFVGFDQFGETNANRICHIDYIKLQTGLVPPVMNLQSYSENTIIQQGTYSLKVVATQTLSLNDTLTNTFGAGIDLSNQNTLKFDIRASRTGSNIKIGIHNSGGGAPTTEITPNITVADVFQTVTFDISSVTNVNKDDIDSIIITIEDADADNTFYIDNFYSATLLTTSRYWTFGDWQSGRALINTDEGLYTYVGTGDVSLVANAPLGKFITIWKKYVFLAGIRGSLNQVRYSKLSDYTDWPAGNTLNFDTSDGDVITGIRTLKGRLYVFKRYSVHRISYLGSNPTFQVDQILGMGCPSHYCIKEVDMGGEIGSVLIFPTTDKKLAIFDGYNVQIVHDTTTEKGNDLFAAAPADDQPITFSDMNYTHIDKFHAVIKSDSFEYILYCVLGSDTDINYAFVFDYKTGGIYPYDGQIFSSSIYMMSTNKSRILYCAGYTGLMWEMESGNDDDDSAINAYWVSSKIKPKALGLLNRLLLLGINFKEITSASTLNMSMKYRLDWNVSWLGSTNFNYDHNDELAFGKTSLFEIGTIENMFQVKITENSKNPAPTIYSLELHGEELGVDLADRAVS